MVILIIYSVYMYSCIAYMYSGYILIYMSKLNDCMHVCDPIFHVECSRFSREEA